MKIQIYLTDVPEPKGKHVGAIEPEREQFRYDPSPGRRGIRRGEISGPANRQLISLLGQGFGERIFRMEFEGEVLNGCKIDETSGSRIGFRFFETPPPDDEIAVLV
jgi:hypothetical protein